MNITVEKKPECMATVKVKVPADKVASERQTIVNGYTKEAKIPGFRPGKAPTKVIEKRFEKQIKDELYSRLINAGCDDAIKQESLKVISVNVTGEPSFSDAGELSFSADIILAPEFEVPEYLGIEIEAPSDEVTDAELDSSLTDLQQRFAEFNDVERGLSDGDFAVVDFTATTDGKPVAEVIGKPAGFLDGREDHWTKIEDDSFMPGFGSGLKGLKAGDKKELKLTMNDEFPLSDVRGVEIVFDVTVKEVKEQVLPELDDDFAAKLLPEKGIEELKNVIREQLSVEKKKSVADAKVNQVVEVLNGRVDFDIPLALLEQEAQGNAVNMIERARQQGMTEEMIIEQQNEISESANKQARLNLKTNFILQEIAIKENIEVSDQEVIQRISGMAQQENKPVKKYIKELQKANAIQNVRNSVLIGKTIDFVVDKANVKEITTTETTENDA
jgi:trigger factor|tara:strand:- start:14103 stop:15437 length:1335 start_codon:yes stop_codon:yes gene_type:complete